MHFSAIVYHITHILPLLCVFVLHPHALYAFPYPHMFFALLPLFSYSIRSWLCVHHFPCACALFRPNSCPIVLRLSFFFTSMLFPLLSLPVTLHQLFILCEIVCSSSTLSVFNISFLANACVTPPILIFPFFLASTISVALSSSISLYFFLIQHCCASLILSSACAALLPY